MNATIDHSAKERFNTSHRRERTTNLEEHTVIDCAAKRPLVTARIYWGRSRCYCCVWIHGEQYGQGSAYCDGCGYHMPSTALSLALMNCGVTLSENIDGVGDSAMRDALLAVGRAIGGTDLYYHHSHG